MDIEGSGCVEAGSDPSDCMGDTAVGPVGKLLLGRDTWDIRWDYSHEPFFLIGAIESFPSKKPIYLRVILSSSYIHCLAPFPKAISGKTSGTAGTHSQCFFGACCQKVFNSDWPKASERDERHGQGLSASIWNKIRPSLRKSAPTTQGLLFL